MSSNLVKCRLCGKYFKSITGNHLKYAHQTNVIEYKKRFGANSTVSEKSHKLRSDKSRKSNSDLIVREKIKQTNIAKFGCPYPSQNREVRKKIKQTLMDRYGVDNPNKSPEVKRKIKKTNLSRYGGPAPTCSAKVRDRVKNSLQERYGVSNPMHIPEVIEKIKQNNLQKFYRKLFQGRIGENIYPLFPLSDYGGMKGCEKYLFKCKRCGIEFKSHLDDGYIPKCPICDKIPPSYKSKYEEEIDQLIQSWGIATVSNSKTIIPPYEIDIYIPDKYIAIEFNGLYWHSEIGGGKDKNYHINKLNKCTENNIKLYQIFEDEWILNRDIIISRLKNILNIGKDVKVIYARNCSIREITSEEASLFLECNHIQGAINSSIRIGLFFNDTLLSVMTFSNPRLPLGKKNNNNKREYELSRFASLINYRVIGAAGKLFSYFIKNYSPNIVYSYADKRWTPFANDNMYTNIGFTLEKETGPGYWYMNNYSTREHRFNYRKSILLKEGVDSSLTEWEIMQLKNYDRIWDSGNWKFIWGKF